MFHCIEGVWRSRRSGQKLMAGEGGGEAPEGMWKSQASEITVLFHCKAAKPGAHSVPGDQETPAMTEF